MYYNFGFVSKLSIPKNNKYYINKLFQFNHKIIVIWEWKIFFSCMMDNMVKKVKYFKKPLLSLWD